MLMFPRHLEGRDGGAGEGSALEDGDICMLLVLSPFSL